MDIQNFFSTVIGSAGPPQRTAFFECRMDLSTLGAEITSDMMDVLPVLQQGLVCSSVTLPSREFETTDITIYGVEEKYPILSTFVDLSCEFLTPLFPNSGQWRNSIAAAFHHWQDAIQPISSVDRSGNRLGAGEMVPSVEGLNFKFPDTYRLHQGFTIFQYTPLPSPPRQDKKGQNVSDNNAPPYPPRDYPNAPVFREQTGVIEAASPPTLAYHFFNVYPVRVESSQLDWADSDQFQRVRVSFAYTHWTTTRTRRPAAPPPPPPQLTAPVILDPANLVPPGTPLYRYRALPEPVKDTE